MEGEVMGNKTAAEILTEQLLAAYRRKRASDGGEGRAYVASEVYAAEHEIERLEKGGVEGAHEGTTEDKSEPEKLNNAPDPLDYFLVTYGFDGNNHARQMLISCWAAARQYERKQAAEPSLSQEEDLLKQGFEGLRDAAIRLRDESSLSSPSGKVINVQGEEPSATSCPACGIGKDTNGDGDCAICAPKRRRIK
jgi:hypothetical protein